MGLLTFISQAKHSERGMNFRGNDLIIKLSTTTAIIDLYTVITHPSVKECYTANALWGGVIYMGDAISSLTSKHT